MEAHLACLSPGRGGPGRRAVLTGTCLPARLGVDAGIQLSSHGPWPLPCGQIQRSGQESGGSGVFPDRTVVWAALGGTGGHGPRVDGGGGVTGPPCPATWQPESQSLCDLRAQLHSCAGWRGFSCRSCDSPQAPGQVVGVACTEPLPPALGKHPLSLVIPEQQPSCPH